MGELSTRTVTVVAGEAGKTVAAVLRVRLRLSWSEVRRLIREGCVTLGRRTCTDPNRVVARGDRLKIRPRRPSRSEARPRAVQHVPGVVIPYADEQVVVVEKPANLTTMRHPEEAAEFGPHARRFLPPTLADRLPALLGKGKPGFGPRVRAVHRLDKETSGLVVFARTPQAERHLGKQFREHTIERRYLAIVRGRAKPGRLESTFVRDRGDGRRGSSPTGEGQRAVTHVQLVEELGDYTLVECRLESGRTHQVRIHLGEAGTPLCGDRVYDRPLHGAPHPDHPAAPRIALHATRLGFRHPTTGKWMVWDSPLPADLRRFLRRLRHEKGS
jgi:23S rRNA pseudouridine1911/1915/1917 synthase